jgi:acetylxylan esterase
VFGYNASAPVETVPGTPEPNYTKYGKLPLSVFSSSVPVLMQRVVYGPELTGYYAIGVGHTVPVHADLDLAWFGITT